MYGVNSIYTYKYITTILFVFRIQNSATTKIEYRKNKVYFLEICMAAKLYASCFYITLLSLIVKPTY